MDNMNNINDGLNTDVLFEGLNLSTKETVAGCTMAVYLNNIGKGRAVELMDKVVDVRIIIHDPKEKSGVPLDGGIHYDELRKLLTTSLNCTGAIMDGGWLHSEEQEAENLRNSVMDWMGNLSAEAVMTNMSPDFGEFLVRLSQRVRK